MAGPAVRISISMHAGIPPTPPLNRFFRLENMPALYHYRNTMSRRNINIRFFPHHPPLVRHLVRHSAEAEALATVDLPSRPLGLPVPDGRAKMRHIGSLSPMRTPKANGSRRHSGVFFYAILAVNGWKLI